MWMIGYNPHNNFIDNRKMQAPVRCQTCNHFFLSDEIVQHRNLHLHPSQLKPKTKQHGMNKLQQIHNIQYNEHQSDTTDVALRSLLPEEIPQDQSERRGVGIPGDEDYYSNYDEANNQRGGPNGAKFRDYKNRGDRLDLNSNLANTSLVNRDQLNKLNIEKPLDLKQQTTVVQKKEIRKYQNEPYSNKQLRDLGYSGKKVQNGPREGDPYSGQGYRIGSSNDPRDGRDPNDPNGQSDVRNPNDRADDGKNEPGYKVMRDNTYAKSPSQKKAIFVPINRKTVDPNEYRPVDTKLNGDDRRIKRGYGDDNGQDYEDSKNGRPKVYEHKPNSINRPQGDRGLDHERDSKDNDGIHPHECPDCHGFWCKTCGATIPPQYRPFWDEDESPEMVEFYKKRIKQERARERRQRGQCKNCNHPAERDSTEKKS